MDINYQIILVLFFAAFLGGISVFLFKLHNEKKIKLLLSFSGSYLFAICVLHLTPEIFAQGNKSAGMFILLGFFLQLLLKFLSGGIEHGQIVIYQNHFSYHEHEILNFGFQIVLHKQCFEMKDQLL